MTHEPSETIGYFGIVMPDDNEFSGMFLLKNPADEKAIMMMMFNVMPMPAPEGALSAIMVEGAMTGRPDLITIAARAYAAMFHTRHFVVIGYREDKGTRTEIRDLPSDSIDAARAALEAIPEVVAIKLRIQKGLKGNIPN